MLSRRHLLRLLGVAGCGSLVAACGAPAASPPSAPAPTSPPRPAATTPPTQTGPRRQLKVGGLPAIGNAPVILAQQLGFFADEGLEVEIVAFTSGAEVISPLATGQIDAATTVAPSAGLVNAVARGLPVKIVASDSSIQPNRNSGQVIIRKDAAPAGGFADLKSLTKPIRMAAAAEGIAPHAILMLEAEKAGLQPGDVSMNFMGLPDMNAAFQSQTVDLAASGEPLIAIGVQQGLFARWKPMADLYPNLPYANFMYGPNLLEKDPEVGERMLRAFVRGSRAYEDAVSKGTDRARIVGLLQQPLNLPPPLFNTLQEQGGLAYFNPDGTVDASPLQPILDYWVKTGAVQPGFDLSLLVDNRLAEAAVAKLGRYQ